MSVAGTDSNKNKGSSSGMPPGMVMGPDGKPCKICTAFRHWKPNHTEADSNRDKTTGSRSVMTNASRNQKENNPLSSTLATFGAMAAPIALSTKTETETETPETPGYQPDEPPPGCPPDVEQLGRATWTFLHTTAAYYPEKPSPTQRANMLMLLRSLPVLYPCTWCAQDFGEDIGVHPPDVSGRTALSRWLCERHNQVNQKLGKEQFDCAKVDERWKDGPLDGSCD